MKRHVDFLSTLYVAWGAIFALVAIAGFALAGGAFAIAQSSGPVRFGSEMAARLTGVTITMISLIALVLPLWASALIALVLFGVIAALCAMRGMRKLELHGPTRSIASSSSATSSCPDKVPSVRRPTSRSSRSTSGRASMPQATRAFSVPVRGSAGPVPSSMP